jgi:tRNA (mo5U34)-methyltransferase
MRVTGNASLQNAIRDFQTRIKNHRADVGNHFPWYPYASTESLNNLARLMDRPSSPSWDALLAGPVMDLGCGDGDNAFFFESLGCKVYALDNSAPNFNRMQGVRALMRALDSPLEIFDVDLDSQFTLPAQHCNLAILLGVLYHLKNPFYVLEELARISKYCFLSTRIARFATDGRTSIEEFPVGWLLDHSEANNDSTNYWIFSAAGLTRLLSRSGWAVTASLRTGDVSHSSPAASDGDERMYCLLESRYNRNFSPEVRLLDGWYPAESDGWRWTARRFTFAIPESTQERFLCLGVSLPPILVSQLARIVLSATAGDTSLDSETWAAGHWTAHRGLRARPFLSRR